MPVTFQVVAETSGECAVAIRNFVAALQLGTSPEISDSSPESAKPAETAAPAKKEKAKAVKTDAAPAAETAPVAVVKVTKEQVFAKLGDLFKADGTEDGSKGGSEACAKVLNSFGAKKITDIPEEKYPALMKAIEEDTAKLKAANAAPAAGGMFA